MSIIYKKKQFMQSSTIFIPKIVLIWKETYSIIVFYLFQIQKNVSCLN